MDWVEVFLEYTEGISSPEIFRLWAGITAVSGAMERRVYVETRQSFLYPNLFTLLVSPPGKGKSQAIAPVSDLWLDAKKFHVAPDNVTKAALVDAMAEAKRQVITGTNMWMYHTLLVPSSEFGVLVPSHDLEFLNVLNHIFDNPKTYRERRRFGPQGGKELQIDLPQLVILAGTQPGYLASMLPEEAWTMGFTSRLIMVYSGTSPELNLFDEYPARPALKETLLRGLETMANIHGKFIWTAEAKAEMERWARNPEPVPSHSKMANYNSRRVMHILKLCMISAMARTQKLRIELFDVERAKSWLFEAEMVMPDIFREMVSKSDSQVIQELHHFLWKEWVRTGKKPVHESKLYHFLQARVPSDKVQKVLEIAERSNIISRGAGTSLYVPKPFNEHGVE